MTNISSTPSAYKHSHPSRRAVLKSAAWAVPAITLTTAAPVYAVSTPNCTPIQLNWTTAVFSRTSATQATFTWVNPFGTGKNLVMRVVASQVLTNAVINTSENLTLASGNFGGLSQGGLLLALDTASTADTDHHGQNVTFSFTYGGSAITVQGLNYRIADIDGNEVGNDGPGTIPGGCERVWVDQGTWAFGTGGWDFLIGNGTMDNPWRRRAASTPAGPNSGPNDTFATVRISGVTAASLSIRYRTNGSGNSVGTVNRVWITPFTFTVSDPDCT